jgi:hypothetical protein
MSRPAMLLSSILAFVVSLTPVARLDAQMLDILKEAGPFRHRTGGGELDVQMLDFWKEDSSNRSLFDYYKRVARARLKAARATPEKLNRAKLQIARRPYPAFFKMFAVGKKEANGEEIGAWSKRLLNSERAVRPARGEQFGALEMHWFRAKQVEDIATDKFKAGVFDVTQYLPAKNVRLEAESELARVKTRQKYARGGEGETHNQHFLQDPLLAGNWIAKAQWEISGSHSEGLDRAKLAVARELFYARAKQFIVGKKEVIPDFALAASRRLLEAELALSRTPADRVAAYERNWVRAKQLEVVARGKYESNVFDITQYAPAKFDRLEAELDWSRARAGQAKLTGKTNRPLNDLLLVDPLDHYKGLARSHFQATHADPGKLARARLAVALQGLGANFKQFQWGKKEATAEFLLWWTQRWLETKLALPLKRASRLAALEEFWLQAFEGFRIAKAKFDAGVFDITQYAGARYALLEAELRLAVARLKK